jgi:hypothetical protein
MIHLGVSTFDKVWLWSAGTSTWIDYTAAAASGDDQDYVCCTSNPPVVGDILYLGHLYNRFERFYYNVLARETPGFTWEQEYWNGSAWVTIPNRVQEYWNGSAWEAVGSPFANDGEHRIYLTTEPWNLTWAKRSGIGQSGSQITAYWWRFRLAAVQPASPQIKVGYIWPHLTFLAPNEVMDQASELVGGVHEMASGARALDVITWKRAWRLGWSYLSYDDHQAMLELLTLDAVRLYSYWPIGGSDVDNLDVMCIVDPAVGVRIQRIPGVVPIRYHAELGLMEQ